MPSRVFKYYLFSEIRLRFQFDLTQKAFLDFVEINSMPKFHEDWIKMCPLEYMPSFLSFGIEF